MMQPTCFSYGVKECLIFSFFVFLLCVKIHANKFRSVISPKQLSLVFTESKTPSERGSKAIELPDNYFAIGPKFPVFSNEELSMRFFNRNHKLHLKISLNPSGR